jgi:methylated-DNA-[protein]-cysteine S-methyltransferase
MKQSHRNTKNHHPKQYTLTRDNLTITITLHNNIITKITLTQQKNNQQKNRAPENIIEDLHIYLQGHKTNFNKYQVDLTPLTPFQQKVLEETRKIPYGEVTTYGELASRLNTSPRAVGSALSKNPVPIIIPCHRVIGKHNIGGFSSGIEVKKLLLEIEGIKI